MVLEDAGEPPLQSPIILSEYNSRCCFCFSSSSGSAWRDRFRSSSSSTPGGGTKKIRDGREIEETVCGRAKAVP
ncbi:hypothetical protein M5689_020704 [Euphorbia peplus]|nr:hypothetical protein M5689_020704 [Euphorbia peplus]